MKKRKEASQAKEPGCATAADTEGPAVLRAALALCVRSEVQGAGDGMRSVACHPEKSLEQESDMVRLYLFLPFKSLAAVWRMD